MLSSSIECTREVRGILRTTRHWSGDPGKVVLSEGSVTNIDTGAALVGDSLPAEIRDILAGEEILNVLQSQSESASES